MDGFFDTQMLWLRPWLLLLLLLHRELLPRLQFLHLSPFLPIRVPRMKELLLGSLFVFMSRSPLLKRDLLLRWHPRLRASLLLLLLLYLPMILSLPSPKSCRMVLLWWSPHLLSPVLPPESLMQTYL